MFLLLSDCSNDGDGDDDTFSGGGGNGFGGDFHGGGSDDGGGKCGGQGYRKWIYAQKNKLDKLSSVGQFELGKHA